MNAANVQLNIRTSAWVARELRERARSRRQTLGGMLEDLVQITAPGRGEGLWIALEPELDVALTAVAVARGHRREDLLASLLGGSLGRQLRRLAAAVEQGAGAQAAVGGADPAGLDPGGDGTTLPGASPPEAPAASDDSEAAVGIFTVFD